MVKNRNMMPLEMYIEMLLAIHKGHYGYVELDASILTL